MWKPTAKLPRLKFFKVFFTLSVLFAVFSLQYTPVFSDDDDLEQKKKEIEELQQNLKRVQGEKQTLSSTINFLNNKIKLTENQIQQTEIQLGQIKGEIDDLSVKIDELDVTLEEITNLLITRVNNTYKKSRINPVLSLIAGSNFSKLASHYKYLQTTQKNDRQVLYQLEAAKTDYTNQKTLKEEKQLQLDELTEDLEVQKVSLDRQEQDKRVLLEVTKNDEKKFQSELAQKLAELEAIQSIIAGKGDESQVGDVNQGDKIASVIPGPSTCSSGAHLHLEVAKDGAHRNPADYLSSKSLIWDNGPDQPFELKGSWPWPLNDTIRITQGYGMTFYALTLGYYGGAPHTGIDMINSSDYSVKAVKKGKLFRGAIACRGGSLRYVRVEHDDGVSSYYLHVNYI